MKVTARCRAYASDDATWVRDVVCEETHYDGARSLLSQTVRFYGDAATVLPKCKIGKGWLREVQGLAEALHFAMRAGLDVEKLIATISKGAAQSWQMENRYKTMVAGKFDFGRWYYDKEFSAKPR